MTSLNAVIGFAGCLVTVLVVAGMILLTPRGTVEGHAERTVPDDATHSPAPAPDEPAPARTAA